MSFFEKAISEWRFLLRASILMASGAVLLFLLLWFAADHLVPKMGPYVDTVSVAEGTNAVQIKLRGELVFASLTVPACQLGVNSGIRLDSKKTYTIRASGVVSTASHHPDPCETCKGIFKELRLDNDIRKKVLDLQLDREVNLSWRDPDGEYLYVKKPYPEETSCMWRLSGKMLLDKDEKYGKFGLLLAVLVRDNKALYFTGAHNENMKIIRIGKEARIVFDKSHFTVVRTIEGHNDDTQRVDGSFDRAMIYFVVNDTVIKDAKQFDSLKQCEKDLDQCAKDLQITGPNACENERREIEDALPWWSYFKHLYESKSHNIEQPEGLWYTDNTGQFNVTIEPK